MLLDSPSPPDGQRSHPLTVLNDVIIYNNVMNARSIPSLARRERERAETRGKILEAARRMFVQKGYEGTTMRAIATKIGYTPTAIYHHFKDKDALVAELAGLDFRALAQALQQTASTADPLDRLEKIGAAYVEFGLTHPMQYQFLFRSEEHTSELQSHSDLVCRLLLEKKNATKCIGLI